MPLSEHHHIRFELVRTDPKDRPGTPGELIVWSGEAILFECRTLELDWKDNKRNVSCIPEGDYKIYPREVGDFAARARKKFKHPSVLWIRGVPDRDYVLCHWGNFLRATQGCVLVGQHAGVHGGENCVWQSQKAYRLLYRAVGTYLDDTCGIPLTIRNGLFEEEADLSADRSNI